MILLFFTKYYNITLYVALQYNNIIDTYDFIRNRFANV